MPDETKKLREEIERWWEDFQAADDLGKCLDNSARGHALLRDNRQTILAALKAMDANQTNAKIMNLVRKCHKKGFTCRNPSGRFGEDDCGKCDACKMDAALAQPAPPAANCGDEGRGT